MAVVTPAGIEPTTLEQYVDRLGAAFRSALGDDLDLAAESPQGQILTALALRLVEVDEAIVAVGNGMSRQRAIGSQLDDLGSLLGVARIVEARSTVTVTLAGQAGTTIPAGTRARTTDGDVFETPMDVAGDVYVVVIPSGGSVTATMRAVEPGPVPAPAATLTSVVDLVAGWETITNAAAASLGRLAETDEEYRARYALVTARNARGSLEAVRAALLEVEGVRAVGVAENDSATAVTRQTVVISAHGIYAVVEGGANEAVAAAIARTKSAGATTSGAVSVTHTYRGGTTGTIRFARPIELALEVSIDIAPRADFPSSGVTRIIRGLVAHVAQLRIGQALDTRRLLTPVQAVPGHTVTSFTATREDNGSTSNVALNAQFTLDSGDVTVTVTS